MPGRHHSAQELAFLKESFQRGARFERGGHTLDLLRADVRGASEAGQDFDARFRRELADVNAQLEAQKTRMGDAFVEMERQRLQHQRPSLGSDSASDGGYASGRASTTRARDARRAKRAAQSSAAADKARDELARVARSLQRREQPAQAEAVETSRAALVREGLRRRRMTANHDAFAAPAAVFADADAGKHFVRNANMTLYADARAVGAHIARR